MSMNYNNQIQNISTDTQQSRQILSPNQQPDFQKLTDASFSAGAPPYFQPQLQEEDYQNDTSDQTYYESCLSCCGACLGVLRIWCPLCFCCFPFPFVEVRQFQHGLLEKFGKFKKTLTPGYYRINPLTESVELVDRRTRIIDMRAQLILTKDNLYVNIDTVVYYRIVNDKKAVYKVKDSNKAIQEITYAALRIVCGEHTLQELLDQRQKVSDQVEEFVLKHVKDWGVYSEQIFIKDMKIDQGLQQSLSMAAKTKRFGESKIISAKADVESAKLLREAADMLDSQAAMQIRYLEAIQQFSQHSSQKILFLPLNQEFKSQQNQLPLQQQQQQQPINDITY